jgi:crotonobetainyl-CoA:carnitine CoA-transferase CaiB-like acyl-CoA transferase
MTGALAGLRVLDFTRVLAGPFCTMTLGDLGADVVKVEQPEKGDDTRHWGPPFVGDDAAYFLSLNRNKRSVTLDLRTSVGKDAARSLAVGSDVLVENFRPGLMATFGLDHDSLRAANPGLVYCSITAFRPGAEASKPGYDIIMQAVSGLMSITGPKGGPPIKVGVALLDVISGLYAVIGILAALEARGRTGQGQLVTVPLFDTAVAALVNQAANHLLGGVVPGPMGNEHPNIVPYQDFPAADRPFIVAVGNDRLFQRLCEVVGRPELSSDPRFASNEDRVRNREDLVARLTAVFRTRPVEQWIRLLEERGIPCAPIRRMDEVFASPEGRAAVVEVADPVRGPLRLVASPILFSATPGSARLSPPRLAEHTEEILAELAGQAPPETEPPRE